MDHEKTFYYCKAKCIISHKKYIDILFLKITTYIIKVWKFSSGIILTNSFLSMNLICLMVNRTLVIIYNLQVNYQVSNNRFILLKASKNISKIIFILMSANEKISLKNRVISISSQIENLNITISYISRSRQSIF